jgi:putative FmdB family regulatory protein
MSKLLLFEFRCTQCSTKHDELVHSDVFSAECPRCGGESMRIVSTPRIDPRLGVDPDFCTMSDKWARKHENTRKLQEQKEREHGPDAWGADGGDVRR